VAATWGLTGLWVALAVTGVLILGLQSGGFVRHSARVGVTAELAGPPTCPPPRRSQNVRAEKPVAAHTERMRRCPSTR
jgi:hypothetical protein